MAMIEIKVPALPESVADATIATWYKKPGEFVKRDEHLLDIETDKVVLEVVAPADGSLESIQKNKGDTVQAEEVVALFKEGSASSEAASSTQSSSKQEAETKGRATKASSNAGNGISAGNGVIKEKSVKEAVSKESTKEAAAKGAATQESIAALSPSVRRLIAEKNLDVNLIKGTGKDSRITTEDVERAVANQQKTQTSEKPGSKGVAATPSSAAFASTAPTTTATKTEDIDILHFPPGQRLEKRVPMTRLRARIAERLLDAQQNAAILTTFNEVNMQPIMDLRSKYKDSFEKAYGVRLGFMSFFTMAVVEALKHFPIINASTEGNDIIYHGFYDIGIAVSSPRGLVVPVLRNAETLTMAEIEKQIADYSNKAKTGQLSMEDITGGTFTISNGGVFGSLMSTPILNPPQSAILGMHKIQERPVAENGQILIRPMMYIALSYDHCIIDGADSVRFLVAVKELLEDPARLALGI